MLDQLLGFQGAATHLFSMGCRDKVMCFRYIVFKLWMTDRGGWDSQWLNNTHGLRLHRQSTGLHRGPFSICHNAAIAGLGRRWYEGHRLTGAIRVRKSECRLQAISFCFWPSAHCDSFGFLFWGDLSGPRSNLILALSTRNVGTQDNLVFKR